MAQELQSSILTCISSNFKTGNVAKDVILLSAYTTAVTLLFSQGPGCVKSAYVYIKDKMSSAKLGNGAPKITIQSTGFFNLKYGKWIYTESEEYNNHLIYAIQNRIKSSDKIQNAECFLSVRSSGSNYDTYTKLKSRGILLIPGSTVVINDISVTITKTVKTGSDKEVSESKTEVVCESQRGLNHIKEFIENCYEEYVEIFKPSDDIVVKRQYYFSPIISDDVQEMVQYNRYILKPKTTFDSIFFPDKDDVLRIIDKHQKLGENQRDKLSFLLHGKPGCGKTSFIKALANYTGRHVINVRLASITTNEQLTDIFHQEKICYTEPSTQGRKVLESMYVKASEKIYIFEDVDADTDIAHDRESKAKMLKEMTIEERQRIEPSFGRKLDKLNMSGLLNVLDGLLELPGAMIVITTNHRSKLDTAFIRIGRVTKDIELGNMTNEDMGKLINYYFPEQKQIVTDSTLDRMLTPATIEGICKLAKSSEHVLDELKQLIK